MRLLLDENLPKRLKADVLPHDAHTVRDMGWNGKGNGELLALMRREGFHALIRFDKNMEYQQNFGKYDIPAVVLDAENNTHAVLRALMPKVLPLLDAGAEPGPHAVR